MSKTLTSLLSKGNLTPKERIIILLRNDVAKDTTGKELLTEADKKAIENWKAKTNEEAREWNRYSEAMRLFAKYALETELYYLQTKADYYKAFFLTAQLVYYPLFKQIDKTITALEKAKVATLPEVEEVAKKQREAKLKEGRRFEYAVYRLAFETLTDELRADILRLYPDAETESDYLTEEEWLAGLYDNERRLTPEGKKQLAERVVAKCCYTDKQGKKNYRLFTYFASIPIRDVAVRFLKSKGIDTDKLDADDVALLHILQKYADDNKTPIETILKDTMLEWLDADFDNEPIVFSDDTKTYGEPTTRPHKELYREWIATKEKAKETINTLIKKGELSVREETRQDRQDTIITGESLYAYKKGDIGFIKEYQEEVDTYTPNLGLVYADDDPEQKRGNLDREFILASKNAKGKASLFSLYGYNIKELRENFEAIKHLKETEQDGEIILSFTNDIFEKRVREAKESLVKCYAKVLTAMEIFKRLSKIYDTDITYLVKDRLEQVAGFIDTHNNAIRTATGLHGGEYPDMIDAFVWGEGMKQVRMKDDLIIEKEKIQPDIASREEWDARFEDELGDAY